MIFHRCTRISCRIRVHEHGHRRTLDLVVHERYEYRQCQYRNSLHSIYLLFCRFCACFWIAKLCFRRFPFSRFCNFRLTAPVPKEVKFVIFIFPFWYVKTIRVYIHISKALIVTKRSDERLISRRFPLPQK